MKAAVPGVGHGGFFSGSSEFFGEHEPGHCEVLTLENHHGSVNGPKQSLDSWNLHRKERELGEKLGISGLFTVFVFTIYAVKRMLRTISITAKAGNSTVLAMTPASISENAG
ncbi:MAG: hypothetical protein JXD23_10490 [Spirochaetales bacterium]|nr:hypothetical protein [Spirochaetales bacterium]